MTPEEKALRDAWLAELWPTCREVPRHVRAGWAAVAADQARRVEEMREHVAPELPFRVAS